MARRTAQQAAPPQDDQTSDDSRRLAADDLPHEAEQVLDPRVGDYSDAQGRLSAEVSDDPELREALAARMRSQGTPCPYHRLPTLATSTLGRVTYYTCRVRGCHYRTKIVRPAGTPPPRPVPLDELPPPGEPPR